MERYGVAVSAVRFAKKAGLAASGQVSLRAWIIAHIGKPEVRLKLTDCWLTPAEAGLPEANPGWQVDPGNRSCSSNSRPIGGRVILISKTATRIARRLTFYLKDNGKKLEFGAER